MRKVIKKQGELVHAYRLGAGSDMERKMTEEGLIRQLPDGRYEVFSQEAKSGTGEVAEEGDYFKVDSSGHPYPNSASWFHKNHEEIGEEVYRQKTKELSAWKAGDPVEEELQFLLDRKRLQLNPEQPEQFFRAFLWGTWLTADEHAVLVIYRTERDEDGKIRDVSFNFIEKKEFEKTYDFVEGGEP